MAIHQVVGQIAWRFDDRSGAPIWNSVENWPAGSAPPPLPKKGDRIAVMLDGRQFFATVLRADLGYAIDSVPNVGWISYIHAQEV